MKTKKGFLRIPGMWLLIGLAAASLAVIGVSFFISDPLLVMLLVIILDGLVLGGRMHAKTLTAFEEDRNVAKRLSRMEETLATHGNTVQEHTKQLSAFDATISSYLERLQSLDKTVQEHAEKQKKQIEHLDALSEKLARRATDKQMVDRVTSATLKQHKHLYLHMESLMNIYRMIEPRKPLPSMSGWAATPELALTLINLIKIHGYGRVLDIGSGVSTVVAGYALQQMRGQGTVVSLEHEEEYYQKTQQLITEHELDDVVELRNAPLTEQDVGSETHLWYEAKQLQDIDSIDLIIVDGPPGKTQHNARYPAVPLLYERLLPGGSIIMDDYAREEEAEIVDKWLNEYPDLELQTIDTEKGIALLRKPE